MGGSIFAGQSRAGTGSHPLDLVRPRTRTGRPSVARAELKAGSWGGSLISTRGPKAIRIALPRATPASYAPRCPPNCSSSFGATQYDHTMSGIQLPSEDLTPASLTGDDRNVHKRKSVTFGQATTEEGVCAFEIPSPSTGGSEKLALVDDAGKAPEADGYHPTLLDEIKAEDRGARAIPTAHCE